jgi:hypothetical protein
MKNIVVLLIFIMPSAFAQNITLDSEISGSGKYYPIRESVFNTDNIMELNDVIFANTISQNIDISLPLNIFISSNFESKFEIMENNYNYNAILYDFSASIPVTRYFTLELGKLNHRIGNGVETDLILPFYNYTSDKKIGLWQIAASAYIGLWQTKIYFAPEYDIGAKYIQFSNPENRHLFGNINTLLLFGIDIKTLCQFEFIDTGTTGQYYALAVSYNPTLLPEFIMYSDFVVSNQNEKYEITKQDVLGSDVYSIDSISDSRDNFYPRFLAGFSYLLPLDYEIRIEYLFDSLSFDIDQYDLLFDGLDDKNEYNQAFKYQVAEHYRILRFSKHYLLAGLTKQDIIENTDLLIGLKLNLQDTSIILFTSFLFKPSDSSRFKIELYYPTGFFDHSEYKQFIYDSMISFNLSYSFTL